MNELKGFIRKEWFHIIRDPKSLTIIILMPIIQLLMFGYVISTNVKDAKIAVYDQSRDYLSMQIINKLTSSGYFQLEEYLDNDVAIENIFAKGEVKEVIVFEPNFASNFEKEGQANIQIIADASDPNVARLISTYTLRIINQFTQDKNISQASIPYIINTSTKMLYNEQSKSVFMFVPGLMTLIMMLISAMMSSISITREKEYGTMEVLLVSPLRPIQIIIGKVLPYLLITFATTVLIIFLSNFIFEMPINGSITLLLFESFLFIFLALSLGILISTVAPTQLIAMFISLIGLMLPTILLSGFIFPIENMPVALQVFSTIMPPRWFNEILKAVMLKGVSLVDIWKPTTILVSMTMIIIAISVKKFKIRLE